MDKYMKVANDLAAENLQTGAGGPFGACVVKNGVIIGRGSNNVLKNNDPTAHAEVMAIKDACKNLNTYDLSDCVIYTSCYPCPMCLGAIMWANIKDVYYGNTKEDAENIGFRDDFIYDFIKNMDSNDNTDTVRFYLLDRDETIKTFNEYKELNNKEIY